MTGSWVGGLQGALGVGVGLELLGAYCVETAQFFFGHFREMQYPLFGAVERGVGGLGEQKMYRAGTQNVLWNTQSVKEIHKVYRKILKMYQNFCTKYKTCIKRVLTTELNRAIMPLYRVGVIRYPPRGRWK